MKKCKLCNGKPVMESGWLNFSAIFYPLCEYHLKEYGEFKKQQYE